MKQKLSILFSVVLLTTSTLHAQHFPMQWVKAVSGTHGVSGLFAVPDHLGNVYVVGGFSGTADFDPGSGTVTLTAATGFGGGANFLAKYDSLGAYIFAHQLDVAIKALVLDSAGNIWIAGRFDSTVDFDPGAGSQLLTSAGSRDIFIAKYNSSGQYLHAFNISAPAIEDVADMAVDSSGNIYITGRFDGTADFDPGPGTTNLTSVNAADIFLARYNSSYNLTYAFQLNGTASNSSDEGVRIIPDPFGNVYLAGRFNGNIDLDPGPGTALFANFGGLDAFVARYGPSGDYLTGHTYHGNVYDMTLDKAGNLYVAGTIPDSMDIDPGPGEAILTSVNAFDVWMAKYDASNFSYLHGKAFVSNSVYTPNALTTDYQNNLYLSGRFPDTVDINPGGSDGVLVSQGLRDGFVVKFDPTGNFLEAISLGSTGQDDIRDVVADGQGNVWLIGNFAGTVDFDPGAASFTLTSTPEQGMFFGKYGTPVVNSVATTTKAQSDIRIAGGDNQVLVDFSRDRQVTGEVEVISLSGQTVATAKHNGGGLLRISLPDVVSGIYIVTVSQGNTITVDKVWIW